MAEVIENGTHHLEEHHSPLQPEHESVEAKKSDLSDKKSVDNSPKKAFNSSNGTDSQENQSNVEIILSVPKFDPSEPMYLEHEWAFWFDSGRIRGMNQTTYENSLKIIGAFRTVQEFWRYWNNFTDINKFPEGSNLLLFKLGIKPMWEDPSNEKGGKWVINSDKRHILESWLRIVLFSIGEQFSNQDELCGLVLSVRSKGDTIKVWNRSADNQQETQKMSEDIRKCLSLPSHVHLGYQMHMGPMEHNKQIITNKHRKRSSREHPKKKNWDKSSSFNEDDNDRLVKSMDTLSTNKGFEDDGKFHRTSPRVTEKRNQSFSKNASIDSSFNDKNRPASFTSSPSGPSGSSTPHHFSPSKSDSREVQKESHTPNSIPVKTSPQEKKIHHHEPAPVVVAEKKEPEFLTKSLI